MDRKKNPCSKTSNTRPSSPGIKGKSNHNEEIEEPFKQLVKYAKDEARKRRSDNFLKMSSPISKYTEVVKMSSATKAKLKM